jgi:hypothetical protein
MSMVRSCGIDSRGSGFSSASDEFDMEPKKIIERFGAPQDYSHRRF